jgi:hypothetical protein
MDELFQDLWLLLRDIFELWCYLVVKLLLVIVCNGSIFVLILAVDTFASLV